MDTDMYNSDELVPPTWMDAEFFETVLKSAKNCDIKSVLKYNVGPASFKGDHYYSLMFRGIVQYLDKSNVKQEISLIIKTIPEVDGVKKKMLNDSKFFENEIEIFRDIIPKFEEMLRSAGDNTTLAAKMLYYTLTPRKVIVLEDITKIGYSAIRQRMCTMEETIMALEKLAKWHACSYILNQETNASLEKYVNGIFNMPGLDTVEIYYKGTARLAELARKTPKLQKYADKLDQIKYKVLPKCQKVYELCKRKGRINVLAHGDFHANNLMYKCDPKTQLTEEIILVDFQLSVWGSMALDLLYFIYMAIDSKFREASIDRLIYNFFGKFRDTLKLLGYTGKLPTFTDLQIDMLTVRCIELYLVTTYIPVMVSIIENPKLEPAEMVSNPDKQIQLYESQMYIDEIEPILERFLNRGYFDDITENDTDN